MAVRALRTGTGIQRGHQRASGHGSHVHRCVRPTGHAVGRSADRFSPEMGLDVRRDSGGIAGPARHRGESGLHADLGSLHRHLDLLGQWLHDGADRGRRGSPSLVPRGHPGRISGRTSEPLDSRWPSGPASLAGLVPAGWRVDGRPSARARSPWSSGIAAHRQGAISAMVLCEAQSEPKPGLALEDRAADAAGRFVASLADRPDAGAAGVHAGVLPLRLRDGAVLRAVHAGDSSGFEYWQIMCVQAGTFGSKILFLPLVGRLARRLGPASGPVGRRGR